MPYCSPFSTPILLDRVTRRSTINPLIYVLKKKATLNNYEVEITNVWVQNE